MDKLNKIIESYPPELKLLLVCCGSKRWEAKDLIEKIDWDLFLHLVKRHRVNSHVYNFSKKNIDYFSVDIQRNINEQQRINTMRSLKMSAEMLRLSKLFTQNGINSIPLKGPAIAYQLYSDPAMRHSIDLDFLIQVQDLDAVSILMHNEDYKQINPEFPLSPKQKKIQIKNIHHSTFRNKNSNLIVEIHWRLITPNTLLINSEKLCFDTLIDSQPFSKIKSELLLHYLIVHGAKHRWNKLFWLIDINDFINLQLIKDFDYFNKLTEIFGDKRMLNQSTELLKLLFNTTIPSEFLVEKNSQKLTSIALKMIQYKEESHFENNADKIKWLFYIIRLKPGFRHLNKSIKAHLTNYKEWGIVALPDSLFFLYYPLRPFLWFYTITKRRNM